MTAIEPVLEVYIDLNIVLVLAAMLWGITWAVLRRSGLRFAYPVQLKVMKTLFLCILLSPALAWGWAELMSGLWPGRALAVSDVAVAAYLRGEIGMPATEFEALLNTRQRWVEDTLLGRSFVMVIVLAAMLAGAVGLIWRVVRSVGSIQRTIGGSYLWRRTGRVDIRLSDTVSVPFATRGLLRRHVVLPSHLIVNHREFRFALSHEFEHLRAGDVEWEMIVELFRPLFFWNPAFVLLKRHFDQLRELSCDQFVVARRGMNAQDYTDCLLDFCARNVRAQGPRVMNVALVHAGRAKRVLYRRVVALNHAPVTPARRSVILVGIGLVFAVVVAAGAASIRQPQDWSHDRLMLSTVVNLERLDAINRGF